MRTCAAVNNLLSSAFESHIIQLSFAFIWRRFWCQQADCTDIGLSHQPNAHRYDHELLVHQIYVFKCVTKNI